MSRLADAFGLAFLLLATAPAANSQAKYDPGVTDSEIKLGQTAPYSGPVSAYGTFGRASVAYFAMVNEAGGINGRKITLLTADDGFSPPKTVEQTRKLVEADGVLLMFAPVGTSTNMAVRKILNDRKIPQLLLQSGITSKFNDPKNFPWSLSGLPNYETEVRAFAKHILAARPQGKVAILYQNDDFGKEYLGGLKEGLGERARQMIVGEQSFELTDPTVELQVISLRGSGPNAPLIVADAEADRAGAAQGARPRLAASVISAFSCCLDHPDVHPRRHRGVDGCGLFVRFRRPFYSSSPGGSRRAGLYALDGKVLSRRRQVRRPARGCLCRGAVARGRDAEALWRRRYA